MTNKVHNLYIGTFVVLVLATSAFLLIEGLSYYSTPLEERFYHPDHALWKPSGPLGHGLGIIGTLLIIIGVFSYMARKRIRRFSRIGVLKYWLEFHIFLCVLGPIMVLFHTAFKFGGIVSVSFWSMVIVVASGVIGRFIYIQIPRTIQGRVLSQNELTQMKSVIQNSLKIAVSNGDSSPEDILNYTRMSREEMRNLNITEWMSHRRSDRQFLKSLKNQLATKQYEPSLRKQIFSLAKKEIRLNNRISRLVLMQRLFRYWHVAHLPFAIIMLVIMVIHVGVTLAFGYRWVF